MKFFLTLLIFVSTNFSFAQINTPEIVNNKTIIQLQKAGLSKAVIISKINSSVCSFDLSTDQLIGLKKAGIADEVIDAMLKKSSSSSAGNNENTNIKADSVKVLPSGIYYCKGQPCELVELEPSVYSQAKSGSGILTALTYGIAKTKQKATLSGAKANLQIEDSLPYFYFYFDRAQGGNLNNSSNIMWFSTATSPNEFILVNFTIASNKKSREVVTGSWNSYEGMTSGIDDAQKVAFKYEKISQGIYRVYPEKALPKGEYCFMYAGSTATYGNAPLQKVFDFGIKGKVF